MKTKMTENLNQLDALLQQIPIEKYVSEIKVLSGSTIGQHIRHILEFYLALVTSKVNTINYDERDRDKTIENSIDKATATIEYIQSSISTINEHLTLLYTADFTSEGHKSLNIETSVGREMAYCLEHSIHHQALIKAALIELNLKHLVNDDFGVAYSTLRFNKKACAQ